MSGHTTAPWQAAEYARGRPGAKILAGGDAEHLRVVAEVYRNEDAAPIAAAPELLEALKRLLARHGCMGLQLGFEGCGACEETKAAIAKAEGRS